MISELWPGDKRVSESDGKPGDKRVGDGETVDKRVSDDETGDKRASDGETNRRTDSCSDWKVTDDTDIQTRK